jgi:hypothetical protein
LPIKFYSTPLGPARRRSKDERHDVVRPSFAVGRMIQASHVPIGSGFGHNSLFPLKHS